MPNHSMKSRVLAEPQIVKVKMMVGSSLSLFLTGDNEIIECFFSILNIKNTLGYKI